MVLVNLTATNALAENETSPWYPLQGVMRVQHVLESIPKAEYLSGQKKPLSEHGSRPVVHLARLNPETAAAPETGHHGQQTSLRMQKTSPEDEIDHLFNLLFENPTNLQTNFLLVEAQTKIGDMEGASATLERVLLIDPDSKLARILFAEVQFSMGNFKTAKLVLRQLISETDTPDDMKRKAAFIIQRIEENETLFDFSLSAAISYGVADNARGAARGENILFIDLPVENTTSAGSESFRDLVIISQLTRALETQTPQTLSASLPLSISVSDANNVETQIVQNLDALEDDSFSFEADFGAEQTVNAASLPSWLTLQDLANGKVVLSGTAPESGEVSFSVTSTKDGKTTTAYYKLGVEDSCTGAYCQQFASSPDTENRSVYQNDNGVHRIDGVAYNEFQSWGDIHSQFESGTATYERQNVQLSTVSGGGDWTGNLRINVDYGARTLESSVWGTFAKHNNQKGTDLSGSFLTEGNTDFSAGSAHCSSPGVCTIDSGFTVNRTCTGDSGTCAEDNHGDVEATAEGTFAILTDGDSKYGALGGIDVSDANSDTSAVAKTDELLVLDPQ
ncbi:MAG: hypothetical protein ACON4W_05505 [Parvibaculales bacterium]